MPLTFTNITNYQQCGFNSASTTEMVASGEQGSWVYTNSNTLPRAVYFTIEGDGPNTLGTNEFYSTQIINNLFNNNINQDLSGTGSGLSPGIQGAWEVSTSDLTVSGYGGVPHLHWRVDNQGLQYGLPNNNPVDPQGNPTKTSGLNPLVNTELDPNALNYGPGFPVYGVGGFISNQAESEAGYNGNTNLPITPTIEDMISNNMPNDNFVFPSSAYSNFATNDPSHYKVFTREAILENGYQSILNLTNTQLNNINWYLDSFGEPTGVGFLESTGKLYHEDFSQTALARMSIRLHSVTMFNTKPLVPINGGPNSAYLSMQGPTAYGYFRGDVNNKVIVVVRLRGGGQGSSTAGGGFEMGEFNTNITVDIDGDARFIDPSDLF